MAGITLPPFTGIYAPVVNDARSDARNAAIAAISLSVPLRLRGTVES